MAEQQVLTPHARWHQEIKFAEKALRKFYERARKVNERYVDERDAANSDETWFNLFHANTNVLKAVLYAQVPKPDVRRKFLDYNDELARVGANIIERAITPDADDPRDTFDSVMRSTVFDRLVAGLAAAWLRIETDAEDMLDEFGEPILDEEGKPFQDVTDQRVIVDYVHWNDFLWSPCRVWEERKWVARRVFMSREELADRFGEDLSKLIPLTSQEKDELGALGDLGTDEGYVDKAEVYEIWDRATRKVIWFCKDYPELLDTKDDFLQLVGFEPCPRPLLANITTTNTVPRPDYYIVQDQYKELNVLNNRISLLVSACRVAGVYDQAAGGIKQLLSNSAENILVPVDNWAMYAEKGGIKGQVDWLPLDVIVTALQKLTEARELTKQQVYELTGISDVVRGVSKASETLGAQQLKAQFAATRMRSLQEEVARFGAEILRIKAELMMRHFSPELLLKKTNIMNTDDAQAAPMAIQMLQSEDDFEWRVLISADQLAQVDYTAQKQERSEVLTSVGQYVSQIRDVAMAAPNLTPLFVGLLKWAIAGVRGAREIEGMLDRELDKMINQAQQVQQQPNPQQQQAQMQAMAAQQEQQMNMQMRAQQAQQGQAEVQQRMKAQAVKDQLEIAGTVQELQHKEKKNKLELAKTMFGE